MKSVTIYDKSPNEIIDIVHKMKEYGWANNVHFDWSYTPPESYDKKNTRYVVFNFYTDVDATLFKLKWYNT